MPIIKPIIRQINKSEALRYAGLSKAADWQPEMMDKACQELLLVAQPACVYTVEPHDTGVIGGYKYNSRMLTNHLKDCERVVVFAATLGKSVDELVESLFTKSEYTLALLINASATALIEQTADYMAEFLYKTEFAKAGYCLGDRFSPGYSDWKLEAQREFFPITGGIQIGIELTPSCSLNPKKSVTAVMPILHKAGNKSACANCTQGVCAFRKG